MAPSKLSEAEVLLKETWKALQEAQQEYKKLIQEKKRSRLSIKKDLAPSKPSNNVAKGIKSPSIQNEPSFRTSSSCIVKRISSAEAAANTANAKKLLASGQLNIKVEKKTSFKRSSNLKRRLNSEDQPKKPRLESTPSAPSNLEGVFSDNVEEKLSREDFDSQPESSKNRCKKEYKRNFVRSASSNKPQSSSPDDRTISSGSASGGKSFPVPPKTGNTIYVYGYQLTEEKLRGSFSKFGNIVDVKMKNDPGNSGFVSYDSFEAADRAIADMHESMLQDVRVKVSLARHQPLRHLAEQRWKELSQQRSDNGSSERDSRSLVVYDDNDLFS